MILAAWIGVIYYLCVLVYISHMEYCGLCSRHNAFRSLEPDDGHPVVSISHSSSGDRFVIGMSCHYTVFFIYIWLIFLFFLSIGTGSCQPKVYDRDGQEVIKFVRGDMYLRDLSNTKVLQGAIVIGYPAGIYILEHM